ncbi:HAD-IIA family hydrolase [Mesobaculum littorinae]|uniref:HAD-IIA family hydrolase n=1 Tax=Mesobaculum littorinae TaxID=2486419 RepID=A0A438AJV4_9RHOB|nr:HAD-IIA family hydrolase [Mesobaculum littorinae]
MAPDPASGPNPVRPGDYGLGNPQVGGQGGSDQAGEDGTPATVAPAEAFELYRKVRHRLPPLAAPTRPRSPIRRADLGPVAAGYDLILFDAYGVLNVGDTAIAGAVARLAALRAAGKAIAVVSNSAGYPKAHMMARLHRLGFDLDEAEVVTSRDALLAALAKAPPRRWGAMMNPATDPGELAALDPLWLGDDPAAYDRAEGFLLVGSDGWTAARQSLLEDALRARPRPVWVGNPDLVAPREGGLSREPGWFAHALTDATGIAPRFLGKPFPEIFDLALARCAPGLAPARVLMVGDTLHTDILGGAQAGFATALVTDEGSLAGLDVDHAIARAGITPDFIVPRI